MQVEHTVQLLLLRHKEQIMVSIIAWTTTVFLQWKHVLFRPGEHIAKRYRPSSWTNALKQLGNFVGKLYLLLYMRWSTFLVEGKRVLLLKYTPDGDLKSRLTWTKRDTW